MQDNTHQHRRRLLDAMAKAVGEKGYNAVTIADLAAEARVSKRSFYEQFKDKADCFIALYESASEQSLQVLRESFNQGGDCSQQIEAALRAYLASLAASPLLLATLFIDIMALGPEGLAARCRTASRFADFVMTATGGMPREQAVALVGGFNEWVLQAVQTRRVDKLPELAAAGAQLVRAVVGNR